MARNIPREVMNYDQLFAGEVFGIMSVTIGNAQTIERGDLIECVITSDVPAAIWGKPAGKAVSKNLYMIALQDAKTEAGTTAVITAAKCGYFNANKVRFGGSSTVADNKNTLIGQNIFLKDTASGAVNA